MCDFKPKHIAIIMDGSGRWAQKRFLPRVAGHYRGVSPVRKAVKFCLENDIENLTLFAFSSENWRRSKFEVNALMKLLQQTLEAEIEKFNQKNIKFTAIGDIGSLPEKLKFIINKAEEETCDNTELNLNVAINYGGKWDITESVRKIALKINNKEILLEEINQDLIAKNLSLAGLPEVDLLIRTSGEQRISNFLLWQIAYAEIYFTDTLWPDFDENSMQDSLDWYEKRNRRFGLESKGLESISRTDKTLGVKIYEQ